MYPDHLERLVYVQSDAINVLYIQKPTRCLIYHWFEVYQFSHSLVQFSIQAILSEVSAVRALIELQMHIGTHRRCKILQEPPWTVGKR
jgi:hypothetical protein